jgi:glycosyltransferase involved in cell wall biosynthesis
MAESLDRFETRRLDGFLCRASTAAERLRRRGIESDSIRLVRDAPDLESFSPRDASQLRRDCGFESSDVVLMSFGVMHRGKGLDQLIEWSEALHQQHGNIGLILVGGGPDEHRLRELAASTRLGARIVFTGWLETAREVGDYCNAADLCLTMRRGGEGNEHVVPGALLRAMACRKVVIAPRLAGISEVLRHGENGFLYAVDDGDDFRRQVSELIRDRGRWQAVADRAYRDILVNYSVAAAAADYAAALLHFAGA